MIIVTGGAGFIGRNIVHLLNRKGENNILIVDDLTAGKKFKNLVDLKISDYIDKDDFFTFIRNDKNFKSNIEVIFHQGACTDTLEWDGRYMLKNNYEYSKVLLHYALKRKIPFIYASSAAVYGSSKNFKELPENEKPLNVYGYSKLLFDRYVRRFLKTTKSQIAGLRYFNVYGPYEEHKGVMASVIFHFYQQILQDKRIKLFGAAHGFKKGEQRRDFILVDDIAQVNLWFWEKGVTGIYNLGTGKSHSFNEVAEIVLAHYKAGSIEYIPFPDNLRSSYQSFTEADISALRKVGFREPLQNIEEGVSYYLSFLTDSN